MPKAHLTVDELARAVEMTTRNVRAYQTRGLLPPPDLTGRTGFYGDAHVERLQLIKRMQAEGLNLNAIAWVLGAAERDTDAMRAVREAALAPFVHDAAPVERIAEVAARLGGAADATQVARAVELGVIELIDDQHLRVLAPALLRRAEGLVALGIPLPALLDVVEALNEHVTSLAEVFVDLTRDHLFARLVADPEGIDPDAVRSISAELRTVATDVIVDTLERAIAERLEVAVDLRSSAAPYVDAAINSDAGTNRKPRAATRSSSAGKAATSVRRRARK